MPDLRYSNALSTVVAGALWTEDNAPAFPSAQWIDSHMGRDEVIILAGHVYTALDVISPQYARCDWKLWEWEMRVGARLGGNLHSMMSLGTCVSDSAPHPEWFYDVPRHELTDGQWMCFWAAHDIVEEQRKHARKPKK